MTQPMTMVIVHKTSPVAQDCLHSLRVHGWPCEKFDAVDGHRVDNNLWKSIGVRILDRGKMPRRPGAQGCWISHFLLWQICRDTQKPLVILEHDAVVTATWPNLDFSQSLVKLYGPTGCKTNDITGTWSRGSHAYTITPQQASLLIDHAQQHGAQALDKHLGDRVIPWRFLGWDLVRLNSRRGRSTTSRIKT